MISKGIYFNDLHSYNDFNLILTDAYIAPAKAKTDYVDIPGRDSALDLTEALGEVKYNDRDCRFTFVVHTKDTKTYEQKLSEVSNSINGKKMQIILDADNEYYYSGRVHVDEHSLKGNLRKIMVTGKVEPYKYKHNKTVVSVSVTGEAQEIILTNERMSVVPEFTCTGETTIIFGNITHTMNAGTHIFADILLKQGENVLTVSGSDTLTVLYQEGAL